MSTTTKITTLVTGLAIAAGLFWSGPANAASIKDREKYQNQRITKGVHNGTLSHSQAHALRTQDRRIRRTARHARHTGTMTRSRHRQLERSLNQNSAHIYHAKH